MNRSDQEKSAEENGEVITLLAALPRVEAPSDFDFGVKARIAAGGLRRSSTMFPFLKVAVPLSLVLLLGAFVVFYGIIPGSDNTIAETPVQQNYVPDQATVAGTDEPVRESAPDAPSTAVIEPPAKDEVIASSRTPKTRTETRRPTNSASTAEPGGGSQDSGLREPKIFQAPGTRTNRNPEVPVRDLLEMLGMKVEVVGGKWMVRSTAANSVAERTGVLANDVVESINDQAIAGATKIKGTGNKTITVGRGGKSIKLDLKR